MTFDEAEREVKKIQYPVTITFEKGTISHLLGALRLGMWLEEWCAGLVQTAIGTYDSHSLKWCWVVTDLINQIKEQTGETEEWKEYGECDVSIGNIGKWVATKCAEYEKEADEYFASQQARNDPTTEGS